jgi:hypothetical protein
MRTFVRPALAALLAAAALLTVQPAQAAPVDATSRTGVDVSWPQCGTTLPTGIPFAVVGVNGGTATTTNVCLTEQLRWASTRTTGADPGQRSVQLYVNTGNPGAVLEKHGVTTWPTDSVDPRGEDSSTTSDDGRRNPYGACATTPGRYRGYTNDLACSWQYGWNRAVEAVDERFGRAARAAGASDDPTRYTWWLDVETMNSWQDGSPEALARNTATLEGMAELYFAEGIEDVGLYSTAYQWGQIVGRTLERPSRDHPAVGANLVGLPSWLAGSRDAAQAQRRCATATGLSGGPVVLNQYILDDLDHNLSCV